MGRKGKGRNRDRGEIQPTSIPTPAVAPPTITPSPSATVETPPEQLPCVRAFKLNVGQRTPNSPVIQFTWCLSRWIIDKLFQQGIKYPYLLIAVYEKQSDGKLREYGRDIIPLHQAMDQISFTRPGTFVLCAAIVWTPEIMPGVYQAYKDLYNAYLWEKSGYFIDSLTDGFHFRTDHLYRNAEPQHEEVTITIENGFFAKESPNWLAGYVNLWHKTRTLDQCDFRRRAILAFTLKLPLVLLHALFSFPLRTVACLCLFFIGRRDINWSVIFHPFALSLVENTSGTEYKGDDMNAFWWIKRQNGTTRPLYQMMLLLPAAWLFMALFSLLKYINATQGVNQFDLSAITGDYWKYFGAFAAGYLVLIFIISVIKAQVENINRRDEAKADEKRAKAAEARQQQERETAAKAEAKLRATYARELEPIACDTGGPRTASLSALPKSHQTISLRFLDYKARVCKPFKR